MPNLLAHYLLIKRFSLREDELDRKYNYDSFLHKKFEFLSLGTQGPDPLFYMGVFPFHGLHLITALKKYGNKLHKLDSKKFFKLMFDECYRINDVEEQKEFQSYLFGQFAHYLLDRECHPYVLYKSGFDQDGKITGKYHYEHAYFESRIDFCLAKRFKMEYFLKEPEKILSTHAHPLVVVDSHLIPVMSKLFEDKKLPKNMFSNGWKNFSRWIKFTNHGHKIRVMLFGKTNLSATRLPKEVSEDVLNETRSVWYDPVTHEKHNETFIELHSRAYELLSSLYEDIIKYGFNYETFAKYIDGKNYYGTKVDTKWLYHQGLESNN